MAKGLIISCKTKNKLYRLSKKNPNDRIKKVKYTRYKNTLLILLRKTRENNYNNLINEISHDNKKLWNFINKTLDKQKSKNSIQQIYSHQDNKMVTDKKDIAKVFNEFFTNVGPDMASKIVIDRANGIDNTEYYKLQTIWFSKR